MKKIFCTAISVCMTLLATAQTVSTSSITFRVCEATTSTIDTITKVYPIHIEWNNITFTQEGTHVCKIKNVMGCDSVVTINIVYNHGMIKHAFSISADSSVYFSIGNLQYCAVGNKHKTADSTAVGQWRFAENQWEIIGGNNTKISPTYVGWVDLFGWGTSGYNNCLPTQTGTNGNDFATGQKTIFQTNYDWGQYNAIINGGDSIGLWFTMTPEHWMYLLQTRPNANQKYAKATVNNVKGAIILPDSWTLPVNCSFVVNGNYTDNTYTVAQWTLMENNGAVFLPNAGWRDYFYSPSYRADAYYYWTSIDRSDYLENGTGINTTTQTLSNESRWKGYPVRLVTLAP